MAILGLTDRPPSFPQIGTLRKGAPSEEKINQSGKKYNSVGRDLHYFRFDTDDQDAAERFSAVYGDDPTSIRVYLPFATASENFEAWQEHWTAGALQHRCDGQTCVLWLERQRYRTDPVPCPHAALDKNERDRCKPVGRLKVVIPELRRLAYVTVLTGSIHDIISLTEQLAALESLRGDLRGVPMILRRTPREISMPNQNGKRVRAEKWLISIEAAPSWVDLQLAAQERAALPEGAQMLALPPPPPASEATGEIIDQPDDERPTTNDEPQPPPRVSVFPRTPVAAGAGQRKRATMLDRIATLTASAEQLDLEIILTKPLDEMTDAELIEHGTNLKAAIAAANSQELAA